MPTSGVILLDEERQFVLLVQGFSKSWGFPKGKVNEEESLFKAAIREVSWLASLNSCEVEVMVCCYYVMVR